MCKKVISPRPTRRRKCPYCKAWLSVRGDQLVADGQPEAPASKAPVKEKEADGKQAAPPPQPAPPAPAAEEAQKKTPNQELRALVADVVAKLKDQSDDVARFADVKLFRSSLSPWESLCQQAAEFATQVGPSRLISISHSEDDKEAIIAVWYWRPAYEVQSSGP